MSILKIISWYFLTTVCFLILDFTWLGFVAKDFYRKYLGYIMKTDINWLAAFIFYLLFIVGIIVFVVYPSLEKNSLLRCVLLGIFFGIITYATYDLTNLATVKNWPWQVVLIDIAWGGILTLIVSVISFYIAKYLSINY
jgi:uncharacterized membrane protein